MDGSSKDLSRIFPSFPAAAMDELAKLFDCFVSLMRILKPQPSSPTSSSREPDPQLGNEQNPTNAPEFKRVPTLLSRSMSEQLGSSTDTILFESSSFSPDSVLHESNKLRKIVSGREMPESEEETVKTDEVGETEAKNTRARNRRRKLSKKTKSSKSLSELEFEELKGFMDLGFVFSEEDNKDSRLVEIVPGLQRLGKNRDGGEEQSNCVAETEEKAVPRPYLSEAWRDLERRRTEEKPLMKWRVPETSNEMDMKDNLRRWAHTVASTVR